jgi:uncharacterized protein
VTALFADTAFWIALINPRDALFERTEELSAIYRGVPVLTTDLVLTEVLNSFAEGASWLRSGAADFVRRLWLDRTVTVERLTPESFDAALKLYSERPDKGWSLTDCHSFQLMWQHGIDSALTADRHFKQAGFKALLRTQP